MDSRTPCSDARCAGRARWPSPSSVGRQARATTSLLGRGVGEPPHRRPHRHGAGASRLGRHLARSLSQRRRRPCSARLTTARARLRALRQRPGLSRRRRQRERRRSHARVCSCARRTRDRVAHRLHRIQRRRRWPPRKSRFRHHGIEAATAWNCRRSRPRDVRISRDRERVAAKSSSLRCPRTRRRFLHRSRGARGEQRRSPRPRSALRYLHPIASH